MMRVLVGVVIGILMSVSTVGAGWSWLAASLWQQERSPFHVGCIAGMTDALRMISEAPSLNASKQIADIPKDFALCLARHTPDAVEAMVTDQITRLAAASRLS